MKLLKTLGIVKDQLLPIEIEILRRLGAELSSKSSSVLNVQIDRVHHVDRDPSGSEVILRYGKKPIGDSPSERFKRDRVEELLATVSLKRSDSRKVLKVDIWLIKGVVVFLNYKSSPQKFFGQRDLGKVEANISDVYLYFDPSGPSNRAKTEFNPSRLPKWLEPAIEAGKVSDLKDPFDANAIQDELTRLETRLPSDYLDLLAATDGCLIDNWQVFGLMQIQRLTLEKGTYYILAEIPDYYANSGLTLIVCQEGERDGHISLIGQDSEGGEASDPRTFSQVVLGEPPNNNQV